MKAPRFSSRQAFTLIELLVVITIIAVLAGLAFPAITGALNSAKKAQASAMVSQLKIALTSYQTEYGSWPSTVSSESAFNGGTLYTTLIGTNTTTNPRKIAFMEFNTKDLRQGSASYTNKTPPANASNATTFVDPWNQEYRMIIDTNYDNQIALPSSMGTITAAVAVWSTGKPNGTTANTTTSNFVTSWK